MMITHQRLHLLKITKQRMIPGGEPEDDNAQKKDNKKKKTVVQRVRQITLLALSSSPMQC
jgi:hypothetical protein